MSGDFSAWWAGDGRAQAQQLPPLLPYPRPLQRTWTSMRKELCQIVMKALCGSEAKPHYRGVREGERGKGGEVRRHDRHPARPPFDYCWILGVRRHDQQSHFKNINGLDWGEEGH